MSTQEHAKSEHGQAADAHADDHHADDHADDHGPEMVIFGVEVGPVLYWKIWGVLLGLLILSFIGPYAGIKIVTLTAAFGIAVVKAYLVCKHFMHLNVQPRFVVYFLVTALAFMLLFFFGTAPDVLNHEGTNWTNVAAQQEIERALAEAGHGHGHGGEEEAPFDAVATFEGTCGACHGTGGAGDGPAAAALDPHPANFTDPTFWATRDRASVINVITNGGPSVGRSASMIAFGSQFSEEQIEALADHVLSLNPGADALPAPEPQAPEGVEAPVAPEGAEGADAPSEEADVEAADGPAIREDMPGADDLRRDPNGPPQTRGALGPRPPGARAPRPRAAEPAPAPAPAPAP